VNPDHRRQRRKPAAAPRAPGAPLGWAIGGSPATWTCRGFTWRNGWA